MTRTDSAARHFFPRVVFQCFSQVRDCTDNDNRTPAMMVADARAMQRWAESRADSPAFADVCFAATAQAQAVFRAHAPRAVR